MDSILSIKNRTKKRKDHQEDKVTQAPIQIRNARYVEGYSLEIEFNDHPVKVVDFGSFLVKHPQYNKTRTLNFSNNSK